jgi:hypothetical protein
MQSAEAEAECRALRQRQSAETEAGGLNAGLPEVGVPHLGTLESLS